MTIKCENSRARNWSKALLKSMQGNLRWIIKQAETWPEREMLVALHNLIEEVVKTW